MKAPKYSSPEIERRWLAEPSALPYLKTLDSVTIDDLYIDNSRMRLRKMKLHYREETQYKLCKKYGKLSDIAEPIVNIYLDEAEYEVLNQLPGKRVTRERYHYPYRGIQFRICILPYPVANGTNDVSIANNGESNKTTNNHSGSNGTAAVATDATATDTPSTNGTATDTTATDTPPTDGTATDAIATNAIAPDAITTNVVTKEAPTSTIIIVEAEFKTEALAKAFRPPPFCGREVSADPEFEVPSLIANLNL